MISNSFFIFFFFQFYFFIQIKKMIKANYKRNNIILNRNNDSNQISLKPINTFSLKPISLIIPQDIDVKEILKNMLEKINKKGDNFYIYKKLNQLEEINRKNIIESMKKFLTENRIKCTILYSSIFLFDMIYSKKQNNILSLEEIALGALILSIKFNNEYNIIFKNKKGIFFNMNEYSFSKFAEIEILCLQILEYKLDYYHPIYFMEFLLINGIIFNTDLINNEESYKVYSSALNILEYIMIENNKYLKYHPFYISCSIVCLCRENSNLEIWPFILSHVFNIQFSNFKEVFEFISSLYKNKNNIISPILCPVGRNNSFHINKTNIENSKEVEKFRTPVKTNTKNSFVINLSINQDKQKISNNSTIIKILSQLHKTNNKNNESLNYSNKKKLLNYYNQMNDKDSISNESMIDNVKKENLLYLSNQKNKENINVGLFKNYHFKEGGKYLNINKNKINDNINYRINSSLRFYNSNQSTSSKISYKAKIKK